MKETMKELISVIVPVYNAAPYLENCLRSVLNQTYERIEIIAVDDGSTDNSGVILDEYKLKYPERIIVVHKENGGVLSARLSGIDAAEGEWVGFVDGDDEIEPDMYERLYQNAINYNVDISHCGYQTIVNEGERIHYFFNTGRLEKQNRLMGLKDLLVGSMEPTLCNKLFRKSLFFRLMDDLALNLSIRYNEDLLMNYYLFREADSSVFEDFCAYHYIARSTTATRGSFKAEKVLDPVIVAKYILDDCLPELKNDAWQRYLLCCFRAFLALSKNDKYSEQSEELYSILMDNKDKWRLLRWKDNAKIIGALKTPRLYSFVYQVYKEYFQNKRYE